VKQRVSWQGLCRFSSPSTCFSPLLYNHTPGTDNPWKGPYISFYVFFSCLLLSDKARAK
jgi:hypothetical protein